MNNLVLYRKYRPQSFSEVVGQEHIVQTLSNAIASGSISHAYLFAGPKGSGKTTLARLLAKSINCQNRKEGEAEPCNKCNSCLAIMQNTAMDLLEVDAASHRGIEEMKELIEGIKFSPSNLKYKVFIIDECHQLSKEAANALLKTLEEPPSHAIFILATTEIHKMISTIVSRCQRFDFRKLTLREIIKRLENIAEKENIKVVEALPHLPPRPASQGLVIEKPALELIAVNAAGSVRDAESLLGQILSFRGAEQSQEGDEPKGSSSASAKASAIKAEEVKNLLGLVEINLISQFTDFLSQKNIKEAVSFITELSERGVDLQEFTKGLINYLRQGLILKIAGAGSTNPITAGLTEEEIKKLQTQADSLREEDLRKLLNLFMEAENKMRFSPILQLPLELAIIEFLNQS